MMSAFAMASFLAFGITPEIEEMKIGGGPERFFEAVQRDKPEWLHMQMSHAE